MHIKIKTNKQPNNIIGNKIKVEKIRINIFKIETIYQSNKLENSFFKKLITSFDSKFCLTNFLPFDQDHFLIVYL